VLLFSVVWDNEKYSGLRRHILIEIIKGTVEFQNWGLNILTISALGTVFFTLLQAWSLLRQNKAIWQNRSGESINVTIFSYWLFYFMAFTIYGFGNKSIAMVANGLLFIVFIPIILGLWKFKKFNLIEKLGFSVFWIIPLKMHIDPISDRQNLLLIFLIGILLFSIFQPYEVWKNKHPGSIEPKMLLVFMATNIFWFVYGLTIKDMALIVFNPLGFLVFAVTFWLWRKYKKSDQIDLSEVLIED
jgi:hypothetical protein